MRKYSGPKLYWRYKRNGKWNWIRAKVIHDSDKYASVRKEE
jgi:hypothetical protein